LRLTTLPRIMLAWRTVQATPNLMERDGSRNAIWWRGELREAGRRRSESRFDEARDGRGDLAKWHTGFRHVSQELVTFIRTLP
jgi:hypothetical protein